MFRADKFTKPQRRTQDFISKGGGGERESETMKRGKVKKSSTPRQQSTKSHSKEFIQIKNEKKPFR